MGKRDYEKYIWELYEKTMRARNNNDYEADPEQMRKLISAYEFFAKKALEYNGKIEPLKLVPKEISGGFTAYFTVFYLFGEDMQRFSDVMRECAGFSIDSLTDGTVCLSMTIPGVFRKK